MKLLLSKTDLKDSRIHFELASIGDKSLMRATLESVIEFDNLRK